MAEITPARLVTFAGLVPDRSRSPHPPHPRGPLVRIGLLVLAFAAAFWVARTLGWLDSADTLEHLSRLRQVHSLAVFTITFVLLAGLGMAIGLPCMPFVAVAGALFGTLLGSLLGWIASLLGAIVGYWIARTIGRDVVLRWVSRFRRFGTAVSEQRDFSGMLALRFIPFLPIGVANFISGLARAPFATYVAATAIGIIPSTVIYAYFADSLLERVGNGRHQAMKSLIIASVLLLLLSLTPTVVRRWKRREARARSQPGVASHPHPSRRP